MDKEALMKMGLTEKQAADVLAAEKASMANFIPKHRFDEVNDELKASKTAVGERDKQIAGLKKFEGTNAELTEKLKGLETANGEATKKYEAELKAFKIKNAVKFSIADKVQDPDIMLNLLDLSKIELDDKDGVKSGLKEQIENLQKTKEFLFKKAGTPPSPQINITGGTPKDGQDATNNPPEDKAVMLAKQLAKANGLNSAAAQRANSYYFGAPVVNNEVKK